MSKGLGRVQLRLLAVFELTAFNAGAVLKRPSSHLCGCRAYGRLQSLGAVSDLI